MAPDEQRTSNFAMRMAFALEKDPAEGPRRTHVTLKIVTVTLAWIVVVPLMVVYGMTGQQRGDEIFTLAALANLVLPFLERLGITMPVLRDHDGSVRAAWNVNVFPSTFVIAPDGRVALVAVGEVDWDDAAIQSRIAGLR